MHTITRIGYLCVGIVGLLMGFLCYLGPSPVIDEKHAVWWAWVTGFTFLLLIGVPSSFFTRRHWPDYSVAVGALLLLVWQIRSAAAILNVHPPFHSGPWTVIIVASVLVDEVLGLLSALARLSPHTLLER
jgi:hypothetical protein